MMKLSRNILHRQTQSLSTVCNFTLSGIHQRSSAFQNIIGMRSKPSYRMMKASVSTSSSCKTITCNHSFHHQYVRYKPKSVRMGWSQHVIEELLPFTADIITSKARPFENIAVGYCLPTTKDTTSDLITKHIDDSYLEIILPFADQPELRESMMHTLKSTGDTKVGTLLYGKLFEMLDALAADISYRHCDGGVGKYTIVTASIDGFRACEDMDATILNAYDMMKNDMKLIGYLTYVGKSSMEVTINLLSIDIHGKEFLIGTTQFIMVARDPATNSAAVINKLMLHSPEIREEFERGQQRAANRKSRAAKSLSITPPSHDEVEFMHGLYLESKEMKAQKNIILQEHMSSSNDVISSSNIKNRYLNFKWMRNTAFKSVLMMHMQKRNVHGKIFGGHVLRIAYDTAFIAAACFMGVEDPVFVCVDDVQFVRPVAIGAIMEFTITVVYNRDEMVVIQVHASDVNYQSGQRTKTNILSYVFKHPKSSMISYPSVMPQSYDEFILYLEGRRTMNKLTNKE